MAISVGKGLGLLPLLLLLSTIVPVPLLPMRLALSTCNVLDRTLTPVTFRTNVSEKSSTVSCGAWIAAAVRPISEMGFPERCTICNAGSVYRAAGMERVIRLSGSCRLWTCFWSLHVMPSHVHTWSVDAMTQPGVRCNHCVGPPVRLKKSSSIARSSIAAVAGVGDETPCTVPLVVKYQKHAMMRMVMVPPLMIPVVIARKVDE